MQNENKNRRKFRDPETCCTPPLVEDQLWTNLSDDPVGVYTDLGGRSSPVTPPPLRYVNKIVLPRYRVFHVSIPIP